jgi:hypothetical protein
MSFDLEVRITGICAFIPNDDSAAGAYKLCVVMPGGDGARFALDDELLCPHTSWIESPDGSVALPKTSLRGMRVRFKVTPKKASGYPEVDPVKFGASKLADLSAVCGDYLSLDPAIFSFPPRGDIMTQVLLREGDPDYYSDGGRWSIGYMKGGSATVSQDLTHEFILNLKQLDDAKLLLEPYSGGQTAISLAPHSGRGPVRVRLVNTCKEAEPQAVEEAMRDRDFKWYYELMNEAVREDIRTDLRNDRGDLPFPRYVSNLIGGHNCFPARSKPVKFYSPKG